MLIWSHPHQACTIQPATDSWHLPSCQSVFHVHCCKAWQAVQLPLQSYPFALHLCGPEQIVPSIPVGMRL